jgi:hypothetical protein
VEARDVRHRPVVGLGMDARKGVSHLLERARPLGETAPRNRSDPVDVDALRPFAQDRERPACEHWLQRPPKRDVVLRADDMKGPAHHRRAHGLAPAEEAQKIAALEALDARP